MITDEALEVVIGTVEPGDTISGDLFAVTIVSIGETTTQSR